MWILGVLTVTVGILTVGTLIVGVRTVGTLMWMVGVLTVTVGTLTIGVRTVIVETLTFGVLMFVLGIELEGAMLAAEVLIVGVLLLIAFDLIVNVGEFDATGGPKLVPEPPEPPELLGNPVIVLLVPLEQ
jgi:hypothetical protein